VAAQERQILERAVRTLADQASAADSLVDEALDAGLDGSHPIAVHAKMLRLELLNVKADLERELAHPCRHRCSPARRPRTSRSTPS
jgi:hypothetical protein